jgi:hypothetical protein
MLGVDEERQPAEHLLLGQSRLTLYLLADAAC